MTYLALTMVSAKQSQFPVGSKRRGPAGVLAPPGGKFCETKPIPGGAIWGTGTGSITPSPLWPPAFPQGQCAKQSQFAATMPIGRSAFPEGRAYKQSQFPGGQERMGATGSARTAGPDNSAKQSQFLEMAGRRKESDDTANPSGYRSGQALRRAARGYHRRFSLDGAMPESYHRFRTRLGNRIHERIPPCRADCHVGWGLPHQ